MIENESSSLDYRSIREVACNAAAGATAGSVSMILSSVFFFFSFFLLSLVGEFIWFGELFFRGDCGDFRLSIGCDQNEVTGCWSPGSSSLGEKR